MKVMVDGKEVEVDRKINRRPPSREYSIPLQATLISLLNDANSILLSLITETNGDPYFYASNYRRMITSLIELYPHLSFDDYDVLFRQFKRDKNFLDHEDLEECRIFLVAERTELSRVDDAHYCLLKELKNAKANNTH